MKKLLTGTALGLLILASCADKKENREEFKEDHNKDYMRNDLGDSAVSNSDQNSQNDTTNLTNDTVKKPTDYESKESRPNTKVGGAR